MVEKLSIDSIFFAAIELESTEERDAYIEQACGNDLNVKRQVGRLLEAHFRGGSILDSPAHHLNATTDQATTEKPGDTVGPYKLLQKVGEGGFGVVYMAEQSKPVRRKVALKVIKPGMDTKEVIARFEAERQALAMMDHPNIAHVLEAGTTERGRPYFVMELVKGVPITEFCDKNNMNNQERLELFTLVCGAVQHAHQKGIIHRDIKPSNIMVTLHDGLPVPKVIDFGVSKALNQQLTEKTLFTQYGQMVGTPQYMSPEQAEMSGLDIDTRSDIYSLGVLLYELLTGTTPFDAKQLREKGFAEMQRIIREDEPPRPSARLSTLGNPLTVIARNRKSSASDLPRAMRGELDWIVMKSIEKDRSRRYDTANAFAADVARHLNNDTVEACPPSLSYRAKKLLNRNKPLIVTSTIVFASLVFGLIGTIWMADTARRESARKTAALERVKEQLKYRAELHAVSGNKEKLDQVLTDLELSGTEASWGARIRGVAALFSDDKVGAVRQLNKAIELGDESLAVHALLQHAYWASGDLRAHARQGHIVRSLPAKTPDDITFRSFVDHRLSAEERYAVLNQVFIDHRSPVTLLARAMAAEHMVREFASVEAAQNSVRDATAALCFMPDSCKAVTHCFYSLSAGAVVSTFRNDHQKLTQFREFGRELAGKYVTRFDDPDLYRTAARFFEALEETKTAKRYLGLASRKNVAFTHYLAELHLADGDIAEAERLAPKVKDYSRAVYAQILAENEVTRNEAREFLVGKIQESPVAHLVALYQIGYPDEAKQQAAELISQGEAAGETPDPVVQFFAGRITVLELTSMIDPRDRTELARVPWYAAVVHFGRGDRTAALEESSGGEAGSLLLVRKG